LKLPNSTEQALTGGDYTNYDVLLANSSEFGKNLTGLVRGIWKEFVLGNFTLVIILEKSAWISIS
jgi:hypothetical protein